jgi:chemotaxis protein CheZ
MPVQRKVFRIEEQARADARGELTADQAEAALRHHEFMMELKALRALIEPRTQVDRESMERARAQIAEAQAYKHELELIYAVVKRSRQEIGVPQTGAFGKVDVGRVGRELEAIVGATEQATQAILQAAEDIDQTASTLVAALKSEHERGLVHDARDSVAQIYEACNFQDLTGQRVAKVLATLTFVEEHVARMMEIWHKIEQFKPVVLGEQGEGDAKFLNGPKLAGDAGHSSQDDIDALFGCA